MSTVSPKNSREIFFYVHIWCMNFNYCEQNDKVQSHTVAMHAFWPWGHEAVLVLMLSDNSTHSTAYTKKILHIQDFVHTL